MEGAGQHRAEAGREADSGRRERRRRLFAGVAVEATAELRRALAELREELPGEKIRWTRLENLHLTVEFFGATPEEKIPALAAALAQAAAATPAFGLELGGLGTFGSPRHPRVLWLGVESAGLARLRDEVAAVLRAAGWTPEARAFAPHLTLGRVERMKDPERLAAAAERGRGRFVAEQAVAELVLYESRSGARGTEYAPLATFPLMAAGAGGGEGA